MNTLTSIAGILVMATLTPGPNNLIVMRMAARSGMVGTLPAIAGVVCGGVALLAVLAAGAGALFAAEPRLRLVVALGGCLCLAGLAVGMMLPQRAHAKTAPRTAHDEHGTGFIGLFALQFLNPKGWMMLLTAVSAVATTSTPRTFVLVATLFIPISLLGLFAWTLFGTSLSAWLMRDTARVWLDRVAGGLLLGMAVLLLLAI